MGLTFNHSAFTLNDLHDKNWVFYYAVYWDVTLLITLIFFPFMLYAIIKKSTKEMGSYKWYLCHQLLWSFLFDVQMSLWKPVPLWPFYMGYSAGIYSKLSGKWSYLPFFTLCFLMVGMGVSIFSSTLHRFVLASPLSKIYEIYNKPGFQPSLYIGIFLFFEIGLGVPCLLFIPDTDIIKASLINQNPAFEILFEEEPSLFGFDPKTNDDWTIVFLFVILGFLIGITVFATVMYSIFIKVLRKNKALLSESTYKLQKILFRALTIQILFVVVLLIAPVAISLGLSIGGYTWLPKFSLCAFTLLATHTLFDFTAVIFFVKVYRQFFANLIKTFLKKFGFKFKTSVTPILPPSSTSATPFFIR